MSLIDRMATTQPQQRAAKQHLEKVMDILNDLDDINRLMQEPDIIAKNHVCTISCSIKALGYSSIEIRYAGPDATPYKIKMIEEDK